MKISKKQLQEMVKKQVQEQYKLHGIDERELESEEDDMEDLFVDDWYDDETIELGDGEEYALVRDDELEPVDEAHQAKKTEHGGAKKGKGAYYGKKKDAKKQSSKLRRKQGKEESGINEIFDELQEQGTVSDPGDELIAKMKQEVIDLVKQDTGKELSRKAVREVLDTIISNGVIEAERMGYESGRLEAERDFEPIHTRATERSQ